MIHTESIQNLVTAVARGRIKGQRSHDVLGISSATFWRWVKEAERRGVRFHKNPVGRGVPGTAWRVHRFGPFQGAMKK